MLGGALRGLVINFSGVIHHLIGVYSLNVRNGLRRLRGWWNYEHVVLIRPVVARYILLKFGKEIWEPPTPNFLKQCVYKKAHLARERQLSQKAHVTHSEMSLLLERKKKTQRSKKQLSQKAHLAREINNAISQDTHRTKKKEKLQLAEGIFINPLID